MVQQTFGHNPEYWRMKKFNSFTRLKVQMRTGKHTVMTIQRIGTNSTPPRHSKWGKYMKLTPDYLAVQSLIVENQQHTAMERRVGCGSDQRRETAREQDTKKEKRRTTISILGARWREPIAHICMKRKIVFSTRERGVPGTNVIPWRPWYQSTGVTTSQLSISIQHKRTGEGRSQKKNLYILNFNWPAAGSGKYLHNWNGIFFIQSSQHLISPFKFWCLYLFQ